MLDGTPVEDVNGWSNELNRDMECDEECKTIHGTNGRASAVVT